MNKAVVLQGEIDQEMFVMMLDSNGGHIKISDKSILVNPEATVLDLLDMLNRSANELREVE